MVAQIAAAFLEQGVTEAAPETVGEDTFRIKSLGVGEVQTIEVRPGTDAEVLSAFGFVAGYSFIGSTAYDQDYLEIPQASFPDPRGNLDQLAIESSTIRVFLGMGSGTNLVELSKSTSFLRRGGAPAAASLTGTVALSGLTYATAAVVTGSTDATAGGLYGGGGTLHGLTLIISYNGSSTTLTLNGATNTANQSAFLAAIGVAFAGITATISSTHLRLTGAVGSTIVVGAGTSNTALGIGSLTSSGVGDVDGKTLEVALDSGSAITVTFTTPRTANELIQHFNQGMGPW